MLRIPLSLLNANAERQTLSAEDSTLCANGFFFAPHDQVVVEATRFELIMEHHSTETDCEGDVTHWVYVMSGEFPGMNWKLTIFND